MEFTYVGDPKDGSGPDVINAFGIDFPKGEPVNVDGRHKAIVGKLRDNSHFLDAEGVEAKAAAEKAEAAARKKAAEEAKKAPKSG